MNKKQLVVIAGLLAYIVGGLVVVIANMETFIGILSRKPGLLMPIIKTSGIILIAGIIMIYFLKGKKK